MVQEISGKRSRNEKLIKLCHDFEKIKQDNAKKTQKIAELEIKNADLENRLALESKIRNDLEKLGRNFNTLLNRIVESPESWKT